MRNLGQAQDVLLIKIKKDEPHALNGNAQIRPLEQRKGIRIQLQTANVLQSRRLKKWHHGERARCVRL